MIEPLEAFAAVKNLIRSAVTPAPVLAPYERAPAGGRYVVVSVVSAPPVDDMGGEAYALVRIQVDVWGLDASPVAVGQLAETCRELLTEAGWRRVSSGRPPQSFTGTADAAGKLWHGAHADYQTP